MALVRLTLVSLAVKIQHAICLLNTLNPVITMLYPVINEVFFKCFSVSVSLRELGNSASRVEINISNFLYLKAVKGAHIGSYLCQCILLQLFARFPVS